MDYKFLAEREKAQEARAKQGQRAGVIDQLLNDANKQDEKTKVAVGNGLSCVYSDRGDLTACS
jgi:hypothetical protein